VVIGWTAASGSVAAGAWILFAIVFLWQIPHFYAIGWLHREDYINAGLPVLSVIDGDGQKTGRLAVSFVAVLLVFTLLPFLWGFAGCGYLAGAVILGLLFLSYAIHFSRLRSTRTARMLFIASALYLPALFALLVLDKTVRP